MSVALIAGILVLALIVLIALKQRSGPRITQITRRRETEDSENRTDA